MTERTSAVRFGAGGALAQAANVLQEGPAAVDDQQIIELYWRRDETAISVTADKYGRYCRRIAVNILADRLDADECVNDTWLKAWNAMPPSRPFNLPGFLGKITRSLAVDELRSRSAQKRGGGAYQVALDELTDCIPTAPGADQIAEDRELADIINRFLRTLPEQDCNVFLRRYWYVDSLENISRRYGLKKNTVKTCLFRTRNKLRTYLEKEGVLV